MQRVAQNGGMYQQMMQMQQQMLMMAQMLDEVKGTNMAQQMAAGMQGGAEIATGLRPRNDMPESVGGSAEASNTKKARQRVADSTAPT